MSLDQLQPEIARRRVLNTKQTAAFCGVSVSTLRRMVERRAFPAPIRPSLRLLGWRYGDICDWSDGKAAGLEWEEYLATLARNDNKMTLTRGG